MTTYRLKVRQSQLVYFTVEAESEDEAYVKFEEGSRDYAGEASPNEWDEEVIMNVEEWE